MIPCPLRQRSVPTMQLVAARVCASVMKYGVVQAFMKMATVLSGSFPSEIEGQW